MQEVPNFFFIGVPKAGTTSIAKYLSQHPNIFVSNPKETCFHILEYEKGIEYYLYTYFKLYRGEKIVCDASIMNLFYGNITAARIKRDFPNSKLLAVLRNPIARAYSDYTSALKAGLETLSFERAFDEEEKRLKTDWWPLHPRIYFRRGLYSDQLFFFHEQFEKGLLKIMLYEDIFNDIEKAYAEICEFLEISIPEDVDFSTKHNPGKIVARSALIQRLLRGDHFGGKIIKKLLPFPLYKITKELLEYLKQKNLERHENVYIDERFLRQLRSFYAKSNEQLRKCYNVPVERWSTTVD